MIIVARNFVPIENRSSFADESLAFTVFTLEHCPIFDDNVAKVRMLDAVLFVLNNHNGSLFFEAFVFV